MFTAKCKKCQWIGSSLEGKPQWFYLDSETQELLLICPRCKNGVLGEYMGSARMSGELLSQQILMHCPSSSKSKIAAPDPTRKKEKL